MNTSRYIEAIAELHDQHRKRMLEASQLYDQSLTKMMDDFIKCAMTAERDLEDELNALTKKL